eukprot:scaffold75833_cov18-Tisochrysis_lutea.AAC.2
MASKWAHVYDGLTHCASQLSSWAILILGAAPGRASLMCQRLHIWQQDPPAHTAVRELDLHDRVRFVVSFTDCQRAALLAACTAVVYTPQ